MSGYDHALRYAVPFLIGGGPVLLALAHALWRAPVLSTTPVLLTVFCFAGFADPLGARVARAYASGSILAFATTAANPRYLRYSEDVLYGGARARLAAAQAAVPPGQPLVAWVSTPFYLEYRRNVVYDAERSGISGPWAHVPTVDYFVIEHHGLAVRPRSVYEDATRDAGARERHIGRSCLAFLRFLQGFSASADVVYDDGRIAVFKRRTAGRP
jgi:hypothetical protein